jgi:hypothetical protein
MITYTHELMNDLTVTLAQNEVAYIRVSGLCNTINWSLKLLTTGATAQIQTGLESNEFTALTATVHSDLTLQNIKVSGTPTASITVETLNETQAAPNYIYIRNSSPSTQAIRFNLRGNR